MAGKGNDRPALGSCCEDLKEALSSEDFDPLFSISDEGILYMSIGLIPSEDGEDGDANVVDHPVFFCPFCGTHVQTVEDVEAKGAGMGGQAGQS
jgi:hypothetical protein